MKNDSLETRDIVEYRDGGKKYDRWKFIINEKGTCVLNFYHKVIGYKGTLKPWIVEIHVI